MRRLYDPGTWANCFMLDGFPALKEGKDWKTRLIEFIEAKGALGMTTNQTLFKQLLESGSLGQRLSMFRARGLSSTEIYQTLYNEAAMEAARQFCGIHSEWAWEGRVSQEASALLNDLEPLVREVLRIAGLMQGVGAFTKIPNLRIGPQAIQRAVASGQVSPNVTLVFSDRHYLDTVEGYLRGLAELADRLKTQGAAPDEIRRNLNSIHSVNSLFVSRVDRVADAMMEDPMLKGKVALAQAKMVYRIFEAVFLGQSFRDPEGLYADEEGRKMLSRMEQLKAVFAHLKGLGANPQRLLIASSGVKSDQPYSPLLYVLPFLGPFCANTMPEGTFEATVQFVAKLSEPQAAALRSRSIILENIPAMATAAQPVQEWDRAVLTPPAQRQAKGIEEMTPDRVLKLAAEKVFAPQNTSLRKIGDELRDKGAQSFTADEQATLQLLETSLSQL